MNLLKSPLVLSPLVAIGLFGVEQIANLRARGTTEDVGELVQRELREVFREQYSCFSQAEVRNDNPYHVTPQGSDATEEECELLEQKIADTFEKLPKKVRQWIEAQGKMHEVFWGAFSALLLLGVGTIAVSNKLGSKKEDGLSDAALTGIIIGISLCLASAFPAGKLIAGDQEKAHLIMKGGHISADTAAEMLVYMREAKKHFQSLHNKGFFIYPEDTEDGSVRVQLKIVTSTTTDE